MDEQGSAPLSLLVFAVMHNGCAANNSGASSELARAAVFFDALVRVMGGIHCGGLVCLRMRALVPVLK